MFTLDIRYLIQAKTKAGHLGKSTTQTVDPRKTAQGVTLIQLFTITGVILYNKVVIPLFSK